MTYMTKKYVSPVTSRMSSWLINFSLYSNLTIFVCFRVKFKILNQQNFRDLVVHSLLHVKLVFLNEISHSYKKGFHFVDNTFGWAGDGLRYNQSPKQVVTVFLGMMLDLAVLIMVPRDQTISKDFRRKAKCRLHTAEGH
jgi:hypothetical protein